MLATAMSFPPLKNDLLLRAARGISSSYIFDSNSIRTRRQKNRTRTGMGHAPGGSLSSWYISSLHDPLLITQSSQKNSGKSGKAMNSLRSAARQL